MSASYEQLLEERNQLKVEYAAVRAEVDKLLTERQWLRAEVERLETWITHAQVGIDPPLKE